jgi:UDP-N-acetylglucosamine/UDP-N-acetyl-alpha-D-glucosaminouronate 4-epimerase
VTGGAGFIGSNLVRALLTHGYDVRVLDNFSTGHRANLEGLEVELVEGDLRSYERVATATRKVDVVFHQAALPSVPRSVQDPLSTSDVNVGGTLNVLLAARDHSVRRLVAASSSSVYGDAPGMPRRESQPTQPLSPYSVSKLAAEQYCIAVHRVYGLETVALRYFNVFGERQDPLSGYAAVIPKFIRQTLRGETVTIFGDGSNSRDFTYVANVVGANLLAATSDRAVGNVFNIATGASLSLNSLVALIGELLGTELTPTYAPPRLGDVHHSLADVSLARELIGYAPTVEIAAGLERTIDWLVQHLDRKPTSAAS